MPVDSLDDALSTIAAFRRQGLHRIVVKEAIGLAGRNAIRLWEPEILESQRRWMLNALVGGGRLVVEPWLERELDFSVQFEMTAGGLKLCGYTGLLNDPKGQFRGNWAEPHHRQSPPTAVIALLRDPPDILAQVSGLYDDLRLVLEPELRQAGYLGPLSIDALIYRTASGERRLKPIVEINPRYTMGRLTLELMKQACPGSHSLFRLVSLKEARAAGSATFADFARSLSERHPLQLDGEPVPRIRAGALCLNDPAQAAVCLATFTVSREPIGHPRPAGDPVRQT